jgi:hypothetical protein
MSPFLPLPGFWRGLLGPVFVGVTLVGAASAQDLSGDYDDGGTWVASQSGEMAGEPSLHALLRREFDPALTNLRRDETAHVAIKAGAGQLDVEAYDNEGSVSWRAQWRENEDYVSRGAAVILRFRSEAAGSGDILLTLEPVTPEGLLQVRVQRVTPTVLGPVSTTLGTYLFHRT